MEILGIGASELIFILIIAIIVLGPKDMQKAGRTIGRWLNQLVQSDSWKVFQKTSSELRNLPSNLMREANMEMMEAEKELRRAIDPRLDPPSPRASSSYKPPVESKESLPPSNAIATPPQPPAENSDLSSSPEDRSGPDKND